MQIGAENGPSQNFIPWWLLLPHGVSGAIKKRGGIGPFKELRRHGPIPLGGAILTSAGRLPSKGIKPSMPLKETSGMKWGATFRRSPVTN